MHEQIAVFGYLRSQKGMCTMQSHRQLICLRFRHPKNACDICAGAHDESYGVYGKSPAYKGNQYLD